jgi:hypothetical protein
VLKSLYLPTQFGDRALQNGELLAGVVAHHANLAPDLRALWKQRQRLRLDVAQLGRIVTIDPEVVDRIAVHRIELDFLAIEKYGFGRDRPRRHHMTIGQYQTALRVDHKARSLS